MTHYTVHPMKYLESDVMWYKCYRGGINIRDGSIHPVALVEVRQVWGDG